MVKTVYKLLKNKKNAVINTIPKTVNSNFWSNLQDFFQVEEEFLKDIYLRFSILLNLSKKDIFHSQIMKLVNHNIEILGNENTGMIVGVENSNAIFKYIDSNTTWKVRAVEGYSHVGDSQSHME